LSSAAVVVVAVLVVGVVELVDFEREPLFLLLPELNTQSQLVLEELLALEVEVSAEVLVEIQYLALSLPLVVAVVAAVIQCKTEALAVLVVALD
jgi:hypothetical protein